MLYSYLPYIFILSSTTPPMINAVPTNFGMLNDSWNQAIPIAAITAVPNPDQMA